MPHQSSGNGAIVSSKHPLALELTTLERRSEAIIRKALASKALAEPVAPSALAELALDGRTDLPIEFLSLARLV